MARAARSPLRRHASLLVSGGLVLLIGVLGVFAGQSASQQAREVHRADRLALQITLAGLTERYTLIAAAELQTELKDLGPWSARAGDPATAARLAMLVERTRSLDAGAVLVDSLGQPLGGHAAGGLLPAEDDPGWAPLKDAVLRRDGRLPVSGVLDADRRPMLAFGLPVELEGGRTGLFLGLWSTKDSALQEYVADRRGQTQDVYIVDGAGKVVAGPRLEELGRPLPLAEIRAALLRPTPPGFLQTEDAGTENVTVHAPVGGIGWTSLAVDDADTFEGALIRSGRLTQALVVALLLIAGTGLVVLHRKRESALSAAALRDDLTGVWNRRGWQALATHELQRAQRLGQERVLVFVDLDGLKLVNDVLGHREGDRAIVDAAAVLTAASRSSDLVGRLGGDEFVLLLAEGSPLDVARRRVAQALEAHNASSTAGFDLRLSLGAEVWLPQDGCSLDELVRRADAAMYADKSARPSRHSGLLREPVGAQLG